MQSSSREAYSKKIQTDVYGCPESQVLVNAAIGLKFQSGEKILISKLSDVQEMIHLGMKEEARQALNQVKYLLMMKFAEEKEIPLCQEEVDAILGRKS